MEHYEMFYAWGILIFFSAGDRGSQKGMWFLRILRLPKTGGEWKKIVTSHTLQVSSCPTVFVCEFSASNSSCPVVFCVCKVRASNSNHRREHVRMSDLGYEREPACTWSTISALIWCSLVLVSNFLFIGKWKSNTRTWKVRVTSKYNIQETTKVAN